MTKRFKIGLDLITIEDTSKEYGALSQDEVVDCLNELNNENRILTEEIKDFQDLLTQKEETLCQPIIKENQFIKRTIKDMIETERTELGRSVLKQLWEAIQ